MSSDRVDTCPHGAPRACFDARPDSAASTEGGTGLVEVRTAVIVLASFVCAAIVGPLTFLANGNAPTAVLAGVVAIGGSLVALNALIR
ncbi:hypothetical protein KCV87_34520 [Actinosynnema pretiosum subsp. pretiosum]|uniref:Uncharacterized protein n=2 Tax=Actinosynnema TaxID=40566 RepID=C6WIL9_ACTMD|nr:hypothetical protein [Actinosynnema mirum]ACU38109.1 hypothetical protein Amir_4254 [Actinosynnema mirum DSM 43827]QUF04368.1 hypothetical protein KCV87_34520 [Actinosynnema pretiosum subsp. pretiosum]